MRWTSDVHSCLQYFAHLSVFSCYYLCEACIENCIIQLLLHCFSQCVELLRAVLSTFKHILKTEYFDIAYSECEHSQGGHKPGKPGILGDFSEHGKLREFCAISGKNCNKQSIFSSSFEYLCKIAVDWVNKVSWISDMVRVWRWPVILLEFMWNDPWWRSLLHLLFVTW